MLLRGGRPSQYDLENEDARQDERTAKAGIREK
jgi:hypothetical protein